MIKNEIVMSEASSDSKPPVPLVVTIEDLVTVRQNGNKIVLDKSMIENLFELLSIKGLIK